MLSIWPGLKKLSFGKELIYQAQCFQKSCTVDTWKPPFVWKRVNPFANKPWFLHVCSTSLLKTLEKGEIVRNKQFLLLPQCFLPCWRTFCHFYQIPNCRLQTLSVFWNSLKFVIWERVKLEMAWTTVKASAWTWDYIKQRVKNKPQRRHKSQCQQYVITLSQSTNFRLFQTEAVCRRKFWTWWKWQKVFQKSRKHCGKRRNCSLQAIYPFPTVFSKDLYNRHVKTRACLGKGWSWDCTNQPVKIGHNLMIA